MCQALALYDKTRSETHSGGGTALVAESCLKKVTNYKFGCPAVKNRKDEYGSH